MYLQKACTTARYKIPEMKSFFCLRMMGAGGGAVSVGGTERRQPLQSILHLLENVWSMRLAFCKLRAKICVKKQQREYITYIN